MDKKSAVKIFVNEFLGADNDDELFNSISHISHIQELIPKESLFLEGDEASFIYFLVSGDVKLSKLSAEGKETVLHFVKSYELFAQAVLYELDYYPVNASALTKSTLLGLRCDGLKKLWAGNSALSVRIFVSMSQRLNYLVNMVDSLTNEDSAGRLLRYLETAAKAKENNSFRLPVAGAELASLIGSTPETVSRLFSRFEKEGIIKKEGRNITILRP